MHDSAKVAEFSEQARALYVKTFGLEHDDIGALGTILFLSVVNYVDGTSSWVSVHNGSWVEAVGLAVLASSDLQEATE